LHLAGGRFSARLWAVSFVIMRERGVTDALTGDKHFERAGFVALLK